MKTLDEVKDQIEPILNSRKRRRSLRSRRKICCRRHKTGLGCRRPPRKACRSQLLIFQPQRYGARTRPRPQFMDAVFTAAEKSPPQMAATSQGFAVFDLLAVKPQSTANL